MQISIIIPIYQVEKYIERCINSVLVQTFTDYEVILVDDASPDKAMQMAEKLLTANRITFQSIKHQQNQGLSAARNSGVKNAKGKYLMFIDSDDTLAGHTVLEKFHATMVREQVDFVTANFNMVYASGEPEQNAYIDIPETRVFKGDEIQIGLIYSGICVNAWNKLIDKDFFINNKLYFKQGLLLEDQLWAFQLCSIADGCYSLPDYSYNYYQTNPNAITANEDDRFVLDFCAILQEITHLIDDQVSKDTKNLADFVFHFRNKALEILTIPFVFDDKVRWKKYYQVIQKIYKNSILSKYEKRFSLPANWAYFVFKERIKPYQFIGRKFYLTLVNLINRYNWEGKILR